MEAKFKADKSQIEELVRLTGLNFYDDIRSGFWVIKSDNLLVALANEEHFHKHQFHELNIELWLQRLRSGRGGPYTKTAMWSRWGMNSQGLLAL